MAFEYVVAIPSRAGGERVHEYASDSELRPGDVIGLEGGYWLLERIETSAGDAPARALAKPARYRLELRHPDGRLEAGAFRRFRAGGPTLGHAFTTLEEGQPVSWQVVDQQMTRDEQSEPYLNLVAERDYGELEPLPDHELEHALAREEELPEAREIRSRGGIRGCLRLDRDQQATDRRVRSGARCVYVREDGAPVHSPGERRCSSRARNTSSTTSSYGSGGPLIVQ